MPDDIIIHLFHVRRLTGPAHGMARPPREEWWAATIRPQTQARRRTRAETLAALVAVLRDRFGLEARRVVRYRGYCTPAEAATQLAGLDVQAILDDERQKREVSRGPH